ncbi:Meiotic recombination protein SPO11-1 [Carex littledalei]|uniref:Meiotic recombination protein SPO11-1 n=1 Tax=Carex littledalei TaxID=544730 RepID=A0A833RGX4_9POAL|nr:Meiotic recombination protein SPO11-1 [Carex littledalei]
MLQFSLVISTVVASLEQEVYEALMLVKQMAYDAKLMRVPDMRWLVVLSSDFEEFNLHDRCLLNLSKMLATLII